MSCSSVPWKVNFVSRFLKVIEPDTGVRQADPAAARNEKTGPERFHNYYFSASSMLAREYWYGQ